MSRFPAIIDELDNPWKNVETSSRHPQVEGNRRRRITYNYRKHVPFHRLCKKCKNVLIYKCLPSWKFYLWISAHHQSSQLRALHYRQCLVTVCNEKHKILKKIFVLNVTFFIWLLFDKKIVMAKGWTTVIFFVFWRITFNSSNTVNIALYFLNSGKYSFTMWFFMLVNLYRGLHCKTPFRWRVALRELEEVLVLVGQHVVHLITWIALTSTSTLCSFNLKKAQTKDCQ